MGSLLILAEAALLKPAVETALSLYPLENIGLLSEDCRDKAVRGVPVLGGYACAAGCAETFESAAAILFHGALRLHWMNRLQALGFALPPLIHPGSAVSGAADVGEGAFVRLGAVLEAGAAVCRGSMVSPGCILESGCTVKDGATLCCGAHLERGCSVGYRARIGAGAVIGPGVCVGDDAVVCPGAVVESNVPSGVIVKGPPACAVGDAAFDMRY